MHKVLCLLVAGLLASPGASARMVEGINVPPETTVDGRTLPLNGAGVRTVKLAFIPIKAYVAAFYAPTPVSTGQDALEAEGPLALTFTFLQGVGQSQVTEAWNAQFAASGTFSYAGLEADQARFVGFFGPLQKGGVERVELVGTETRVFDGGIFKGTIPGRNFQKAFLSLWFGSKPVMPSLKNQLLGR